MNRLSNLYLLWLVEQVMGDSDYRRYSLLINHLYSTPFVYSEDVPLDSNLVVYGEGLRLQFLDESIAGRRYYETYGGFDEPCSVLELMVYLALAAENDIMQNSYYGNRTSTWFWTMMRNLRLDGQDNTYFDAREVDGILNKFMRRKYSKDGNGGLFRTKNSVKNDMKTAPIWKQMNIFLSEYAMKDGEI